MSKRIKKLIWACAFLVMFLIIAIIAYSDLRKIERITPDAAYLCDESGVGITLGKLSDMKALSHMQSLYALGLSKTEAGVVSAKSETQNANIVYATPMDNDIVPVKFTSGAWFSDWTEHSQSAAVISASLAEKLHEPTNVTVNGKDYPVCGVYKDDYDCRVFLRDPEADTLPISELYLSDKRERDLFGLEQWVSGVAETRVTGDTTDYRIQIKLVKSLFYIELMLCALFLSALLFAFGGSFITKTHEELGKKPWRVFVGAAIIAITLLCLKLIFDRLYIPSVYLPPENIFDFRYYADTFSAWIQRIGAKGVCGSFDRYFASKTIVSLSLGFVGVVLFCIGSCKAYLNLRKKE